MKKVLKEIGFWIGVGVVGFFLWQFTCILFIALG